MEMNSDLINPDLDGEEYANACPTVGTLKIACFSTPNPDGPYRSDIHQIDCEFFASHQGRRIYIRPAIEFEYDFEPDANRPKLWVLVTEIARGFHHRLPIWRGRAFWTDVQVDSDEGTGFVYLEACKRGGLSVSEWYGFISDQRTRKAERNAARKRSKKLVN